MDDTLSDYAADVARRIFAPPPMPDIDWPLVARLGPIKKSVKEAFDFAYWAGVKDGLMWGFIFALLIIVAILVVTKLNPANLVKGLVDAIVS